MNVVIDFTSNVAGCVRTALKKREEEVKRRMKRKANRWDDRGEGEGLGDAKGAKRQGCPTGTDCPCIQCANYRDDGRRRFGRANGRERKKASEAALHFGSRHTGQGRRRAI